VLIGELVPHCQINNKVLFFVLIMVQNLNVTTTNVYGGHPITDNARSANNRMVLYTNQGPDHQLVSSNNIMGQIGCSSKTWEHPVAFLASHTARAWLTRLPLPEYY
jgi:hypothetical protein